MLLIPRWFIKGPVRGEFAVEGTPAEVEARLLAAVDAARAYAEEWDADDTLEAWRSYPGLMVCHSARHRGNGMRPKLKVLATATGPETTVRWQLCHQASDVASLVPQVGMISALTIATGLRGVNMTLGLMWVAAMVLITYWGQIGRAHV